MKDVFIACVDGLKGFPGAIETVFPQAQVQLCIVHLVRSSLNYVSWQERKRVAAEPEDHLPRNDGGRGRAGAGRVCRPMGPEVSDNRGALAAPLATGDSVLRLSG